MTLFLGQCSSSCSLNINTIHSDTSYGNLQRGRLSNTFSGGVFIGSPSLSPSPPHMHTHIHGILTKPGKIMGVVGAR